MRLVTGVLAALMALGGPAWQANEYRDGHTRPRALAFSPDDGLLYVALSTADEVAIVDPRGAAPRVKARVRVCRFPDVIVAAPGGGALVSCRFEAGLRRVEGAAGVGAGAPRVRVLDAGPESGARGLAIAPAGDVAYVASPATGGIKVVSLAGAGVIQRLPTGTSPRALRILPAGALPGRRGAFLLVSNFIEHVVTVHPIGSGGSLGPAAQAIRTEAPVLDMLVGEAAAGGERGDRALWLFTHEDRALSRVRGPVEGLDSGVLVLAAAAGGPAPFEDPGPGRRRFVNLGERATPVIELAGAAALSRARRGGEDDEPGRAAWAVVGAGSDNLFVGGHGDASLMTGAVVSVGTNPTAVAALPGERFVTADWLSDTLTFVAGGRVVATLDVGVGERPTAPERGELLFYGRALVPNNVADGASSLYTCAACHDDGQIDGRRHPAKRNRFFSMTKACQGLGTTAPYLSLGDPETIDAFADNIVATHAQGAERDPTSFDRYPVTLRVRSADAWGQVVLPPAEVRRALARYMEQIPPEPSPFVAAGTRALGPEARRGLATFKDACAGCHQLVGNTTRGNAIPAGALERRLLAGQVALTSPRLHAVGTPELGKGGNNPPSLRGVWNADPYFSDGSARTLEEVLRRTNPEAPRIHAPENASHPAAFSEQQTKDLLIFLRSL